MAVLRRIKSWYKKSLGLRGVDQAVHHHTDHLSSNMWNLLYFLLGLTTLVQSSPAVLQKRQAKWEFLPKTPTLPDPFLDTRFEVDGVSLWLNEYNKKPEVPLVFLHGGLGSSEYWADVVKLAIDAGYYCILVDLRGHGRSSYLKDDKFTYELYAKNVFDLLNSRNIGPDYVWIGWSDGAAATLAALLDPTIGRRLYKAFVFAGFQNPSDTNPNFPNTAIYKVNTALPQNTLLLPR